MKIKEITVGKEMKVGLPNYSNVTAQCHLTFEIADGEKADWDKAWDVVNQQLSSQVNDVDPSWIKSQEFNKFFKVTVKVPKNGVKNER